MPKTTLSQRKNSPELPLLLSRNTSENALNLLTQCAFSSEKSTFSSEILAGCYKMPVNHQLRDWALFSDPQEVEELIENAFIDQIFSEPQKPNIFNTSERFDLLCQLMGLLRTTGTPLKNFPIARPIPVMGNLLNDIHVHLIDVRDAPEDYLNHLKVIIPILYKRRTELATLIDTHDLMVIASLCYNIQLLCPGTTLIDNSFFINNQHIWDQDSYWQSILHHVHEYHVFYELFECLRLCCSDITTQVNFLKLTFSEHSQIFKPVILDPEYDVSQITIVEWVNQMHFFRTFYPSLSEIINKIINHNLQDIAQAHPEIACQIAQMDQSDKNGLPFPSLQHNKRPRH